MPRPIKEIPPGTRFRRLVTTGRSELRSGGVKNPRNRLYCEVECDCGEVLFTRANNLRTGASRSCGCLQKEATRKMGKQRRTHGRCGSAEYISWKHLKDRCLNSKNKGYSDYGGRGIKVCDSWKDSFENFYADMGPKPGPKYSIDRIDNEGNYEPGNCRWGTQQEQSSNRRLLKKKSNLPVGVCKSGNRFRAKISYQGRRIYIGTFDDAQTASEEYLLWKKLKMKALEFEREEGEAAW